MKGNKIYLMLSLIVLHTSSVQSVTVFLNTNQMIYLFNQQMRAFDDCFDAVREEMCKMCELMNSEWQTPTQEDEKKEKISELLFDIEDKNDAKHVAVVVEGVNLDESADIQAKIEFDNDENPVKLLIDIFDRSICIDYTPQYRFLSVAIKHEMKKEQKRDQSTTQVVQIGTARHGKTLREGIQLDKSQITYNKKKETLIVAIPKATKKKVKTIIPINIK